MSGIAPFTRFVIEKEKEKNNINNFHINPERQNWKED